VHETAESPHIDTKAIGLAEDYLWRRVAFGTDPPLKGVGG